MISPLMLLFLVSQQADPNSPNAADNADPAIDCLDAAVKSEMMIVSNDKPQKVVDTALKKCQPEISKAVKNILQNYPESNLQNQNVVDKITEDWRKLYEEHVDKLFITPSIADVRTRLSINEWRTCVTEKAKLWSRLADDAKTIAQAAVSACNLHEQHFASAIAFEMRAKKLPVSWVSEDRASFVATMNEVAVEAVISERGKRLPK